MMIDATVAPKVEFVSPFGTTACNVNHINAMRQARLKAEAQRTLEAVACMPWLDFTEDEKRFLYAVDLLPEFLAGPLVDYERLSENRAWQK